MRLFHFLFLLFCFQFSFAQLQATKDEVEKLKTTALLQNASWGFCIIDNSTGDIILDKDKNKSLIPASSTKTITTSTALALLGENYTFNTKVYYSGLIKDAVLTGNIIVVGSGDPTLASSKMDGTVSEEKFVSDIIAALKVLGITKIEGKIITDASVFNDLSIPRTWNWSDIGNHFGTGSFGINFADNEFSVKCNPTKLNQAPTIEIKPNIPSLRIHNNFYCSNEVSDGDKAYIFGGPFSNDRFLDGPVPLNASISVKGSMPDPPMYLASLLTEKIAQSGIMISQFPTTNRIIEEENEKINSADKKLLCSFTSPTLKEIISATNQKSINLYAETLLKTIAKEKTNAATCENGLKQIYAYWTAQGVDLTGFFMNDGSGLSRHNAISPYHFSQILYAISKQSYATTFKSSLAIAGQSGTLKNLCAGTEAAGKIIAKSGTVERGISYTGYVQSSSGKQLSFSMIFNNYNGSNAELRKKIEQLMIYMSKI